MTSTANSEPARSTHPTLKKRLGQYFTGLPLARLLASISQAQKARSIIDPMSGNGDMIEACFQMGARPESLVGVEIDPAAHRAAVKRFGATPSNPTRLLLGNAFSFKLFNDLPALTYDLVITNPPYVRYQSFSHGNGTAVTLPDAKAVRTSLLQLVESFPSLDPEDQHLLRHLIKSYSGLSDLAVPSWLLCAMLTRIGGTLAMVVPDAWLSRDYAQVIQYILLRWFRIRYVVEDSNAAWFAGTLIKTTLVVADRIKRRDSAFSWADEDFLFVHLPSHTMNETSVVGEIYPGKKDPELRFAKLLSAYAKTRQSPPDSLFSLERIALKQKAENLRSAAASSGWLQKLEGGSHSVLTGGDNENGNRPVLHPTLRTWLGSDASSGFSSPEGIGVNISQGLRTGANQFFYVEALGQDGEALLVAPDPVFNLKTLRLPKHCVLQVLRKQAELPSGFQLESAALKGRVLTLHRYALPEDLEATDLFGDAQIGPFERMPDELSKFVRRVAETNVGESTGPKFIPEMSAVKTNVRKTDARHFHSTPRFWYMLPEFTPRHRPDLFVARINNTHPKTYLNSQERVLIDANFSTIWLDDETPITPLALLAVLNSSWCVAAMELTGAVMGGGALKLEATHLRRLPIPNLAPDQWNLLDQLGTDLAEQARSADILTTIDRIVTAAMHSGSALGPKIASLERINREQLAKRSTRI
jgi:hypothetical protein